MLFEFGRNTLEQLLIFEDLQLIAAVIVEGDDAGISFDVDAFKVAGRTFHLQGFHAPRELHGIGKACTARKIEEGNLPYAFFRGLSLSTKLF